jgi:hypothetical protein
MILYDIIKGTIMNYLSVKDFAKRMDMCPQSIRIAIRKGRLYAIRPSIGVKAPYRIPESECERLLIAIQHERRK